MQNTHNKQPGGIQSAQPLEGTLSYSEVVNGNYPVRPAAWMESLPSMDKCRWHPDGGFWYETAEDLARGLVDSDTTTDWPVESIQLFGFPNLGFLRVAVVDGIPWASLSDVGDLCGLAEWRITGGRYPDDQHHVRGVPGHLIPEGIIFIRHGLFDDAIRLEAVPGVMRRNHLREDLIRWAESLVVLSGIEEDECQFQTQENVDTRWPITVIPDGGKLAASRLYSSSFGGALGVLLGMWTWIDLYAVSERTGFDIQTVKDLAGPRRLVNLPEFLPLRPRADEDATVFVRSDVAEALTVGRSRAVDCIAPWSAITTPGLARWTHKSETTVSVSVLREVLGDPPLMATPGCGVSDLTIGAACRIAVEIGGFAGWVTAVLLADGGYLHGGRLDETPTETLTRFKGLIPDGNGRVALRKVWEFVNPGKTFKEWLGDNLPCNLDCHSIIEGAVPPRDAWRLGINDWAPPPGWIGTNYEVTGEMIDWGAGS